MDWPVILVFVSFRFFIYQIGENERVYKSDWMCQSLPSSRILSAFNGNVSPTSVVWIKHVGDNSNNPMTMYSHTHLVYDYKNQCMFFTRVLRYTVSYTRQILEREFESLLVQKYLSAFWKTFFILCKTSSYNTISICLFLYLPQ